MSEQYKPYAASYLILQNQQGQILLTQRSGTGYMDGMYSLPAGHIDADETARHAMVREAYEEVGLSILVDNLCCDKVLHRQAGEREYIDFFFVCNKWDGEIINKEPEKCSDIAWFDLGALPENITPELQFVLDRLGNGEVSKEMIDLYIPGTVDHPKTRIRKQGDAYEFTKKSPVHDGDASQQLERTVILDRCDFECLSVVDAKRVEKVRYYYAEDEFNYEIDVFTGDLTGLVLVDVEFSDDESQDAFVMPDWCLVDVTQETFVAGGMLAGKSYQDIAGDLDRLGYEKI